LTLPDRFELGTPKVKDGRKARNNSPVVGEDRMQDVRTEG